MVNGRRRRPREYPLIMASVFLAYEEQLDTELWRVFFNSSTTKNHAEQLSNLIIICLLGVMIVSDNRVATNPHVIRIDRFLGNYSDRDLYHIVIRNR